MTVSFSELKPILMNPIGSTQPTLASHNKQKPLIDHNLHLNCRAKYRIIPRYNTLSVGTVIHALNLFGKGWKLGSRDKSDQPKHVALAMKILIVINTQLAPLIASFTNTIFTEKLCLLLKGGLLDQLKIPIWKS